MRTFFRSLFPSIVCLVAGLPVLPGQVRPGGTGRPYALPLQVSPNHRYLADAQGKPFLYHADTGWKRTDSEQRQKNLFTYTPSVYP